VIRIERIWLATEPLKTGRLKRSTLEMSEKKYLKIVV